MLINQRFAEFFNIPQYGVFFLYIEGLTLADFDQPMRQLLVLLYKLLDMLTK